ncbi:MAG: oligoendopeptidase F [Candidatus Hydrogenedentes bacterium]|nr:oligoendopeptidase F [Candidatus Hydrogenedentota bacterium]
MNGPIPRAKVAPADTWDLKKIFSSDKAWEEAFNQLETRLPELDLFRGKLKRSARQIKGCFDTVNELSLLLEKLGAYAQLKYSEDITNPNYQIMAARFSNLATRYSESVSFVNPEIQEIPKTKMKEFLKSPLIENYLFSLENLLRYRPHILGLNEERLLAMQGEVAETPSRVFDQLSDGDMKFGEVVDEKGNRVEVTQSSFRALLDSPLRKVRKEAFHKYYAVMEGHGNTLAATLNGSVLQDVYVAQARNYASAREAALFDDKMPTAAYDALIAAVREALPVVHRYLGLRKKALRLKQLHFYDTYTPIVKDVSRTIDYEEAVDLCCEAVAPLGSEYVKTLRLGLTKDRWVDRYENRGKSSGAFSYGCYGCPPYILMNYKSNVLDSVFTLIHEAGHSMHSWYSMRAQPYHYAHYPILLAEVASTFNEQLLGRYMLDHADSKGMCILLINKQIDEIRGTIFRQTMFAEYEKIIHELVESGNPLTLAVLREEYRKLLDDYFGSAMHIDAELELEGLRIPHFYRAFYVYKYATGLSSAIALSRNVLEGGAKECQRYLDFLSAGGSRYPLDTLKTAGVDLTKPKAVEQAMEVFAELVNTLEQLMQG